MSELAQNHPPPLSVEHGLLAVLADRRLVAWTAEPSAGPSTPP
jgi:hypothetical protein